MASVDLESKSSIEDPTDPRKCFVCRFIDNITFVAHIIFFVAISINCGWIITHLITSVFSKWAIGVLILCALIAFYYISKLACYQSKFVLNINRYPIPIMMIPIMLYIIIIQILYGIDVLAMTHTEFMYDTILGCMLMFIFIVDFILYQLSV